MREVWDLIPGSVKSESDNGYSHRCDVSSKVCCPGVKPRRRTLHSLRAKCEYNEDLIFHLVLEPAPVKPELKKFEGYLKQEEINDEVYMLVHQLSHSADKLTQANAHLLAAVGKKVSWNLQQ